MSRIISIVKKDLAQVFRNRFVAVISLLVIIFFAIVYNFLPSDVNETIKFGFYLEIDEATAQEYGLSGGRDEIAERFKEAGGEEAQEGVELVWADTLDDLKRIVEDEEVSAGISLDLSGQEPDLVLFVSSKAPDETIDASEAITAEIGYALIGYELPADFEATIIGPDLVGQQVPMRDKLRVMLLAFIFILELYGLANLLVEEIQHKTAEALLVTPVTLQDFISAKAVTGIIMAFTQGLLLAFLIQAISVDTWLAIVILLLLGAAMTVGLAFIMGAVSRDFTSMVMISFIPFVVLIIPSLVLLDPGLSSPVLKAIPTYYLVVPLDGILNYQMALSDYLAYLLYLALFTAAFFVLGFVILRRRLA